MKSSEKFTNFLLSLNESVSKQSDKDLIKAVVEAYNLLENAYIFKNDNKRPEMKRNRSMSPEQSDDEIDANNAELERRQKAANQAGGRLKGVQTQLLKAAKIAPMDIEEFIKGDELKDAIKTGKAELDRQFGTDTGKRSLVDRLKGAVKGFTEAEDENQLVEYDSLPDNVKDIFDSWDDNKDLYKECSRIKDELNAIGWTCDYGLDGEVYDVRKLTNQLVEYDSLPDNVKDIFDSWDDNKDIYKECTRIKDELNAIGWTCDYGLDGEVYDLRKLTAMEGTGFTEAEEEAEEKRYAVTLDAYLYAENDEDAKIKAENLAKLLRTVEDNNARAAELYDAPFGAGLGTAREVKLP